LNTFLMVKNLLKSAGWSDEQLEPITIQEKVIIDLIEEEKMKAAQPKPVMTPTAISERKVGKPAIEQSKLDLLLTQEVKMQTYKSLRQKQQALESKAFELIDKAQKLYKFVDIDRDYIGAIKLYQEAIKLLAQAGWQDQVEYLEDEIAVLKTLHAKEVQEKKRLMKEEKLRKNELERKRREKEEFQKSIQENIEHITSILENISEDQKKAVEEERIKSIKQELMAERRYKSIVANKRERKSFDSLKEMLFGSPEKIDEEELERAKEEEFLSKMSSKFFSQKRKLKSEIDKVRAKEELEVRSIIDNVSQREKENIQATRKRIKVIDPHLKQKKEMEEMEKEKNETFSNVLSMLKGLKEEKKDTSQGKKDENKKTNIKDEELKKLLEQLKK
ncbi:MAG: hypothetical protein ACTSRA_19100, partial [Promethearchaeota archaeon]